MKFIFYRYGSICEPDLIDSFQDLGHQVIEICEEMHNKELVFSDHVRILNETLQTQPADAIFTINFFPIISEVCNIYKIPYISWIVDAPLLELFSSSIQNPYNRVFIFDQALYEEVHPFHPDTIFHFPLGSSIKKKEQAILSARPLDVEHFTHKLSFIGSMYTEKCPYDKLVGASEYLKGYLSGIIQAQKKIYGYYFVEEMLTDDLVTEFKSNMPNFYEYPLKNFLTDSYLVSHLYLGNKITAEERIETMSCLWKNFQIALYTGSDTFSLFSVPNLGTAKTLTEMPIIFRNSQINLNTTAKSIRTGLPLRIFDIAASQGFILTNYQSELANIFEIKSELDCYFSLEDLVEKTHYYLEHPSICKEMAHAAYEKVKNTYTFTIRLELLLRLAFS